MRFQVPQFIEVEDKIFGPLTLRQFIYIAGGVGIAILFWAILPRFLAFLLAAPFVGFAIALAFVKVNNRPFIEVVESAFAYISKNRLYIWKKQEHKVRPKMKKGGEKENESLLQVPALSESKLKDLAWSLDIQESIYSDTDQQK